MVLVTFDGATGAAWTSVTRGTRALDGISNRPDARTASRTSDDEQLVDRAALIGFAVDCALGCDYLHLESGVHRTDFGRVRIR